MQDESYKIAVWYSYKNFSGLLIPYAFTTALHYLCQAVCAKRTKNCGISSLITDYQLAGGPFWKPIEFQVNCSDSSLEHPMSRIATENRARLERGAMHESIVPEDEIVKSNSLLPVDGFCRSCATKRSKIVEKHELPVTSAMQPDWLLMADAIERSDLTTIELVEMTCVISRILDCVDLAFEKHGISTDSPAFGVADKRQSN